MDRALVGLEGGGEMVTRSHFWVVKIVIIGKRMDDGAFFLVEKKRKETEKTQRGLPFPNEYNTRDVSILFYFLRQ